MDSFLQVLKTSLVLLAWVNLSKSERRGGGGVNREGEDGSHLSTDTSTHTETAASPHLQFYVKTIIRPSPLPNIAPSLNYACCVHNLYCSI